MIVEDVTPLDGELIEFTGEDEYIRYSADNWRWCIGESTETVHMKKEIDMLESAYQLWKSKQK